MTVTIKAELTISLDAKSSADVQDFIDQNSSHLLIAAALALQLQSSIKQSDELFGISTMSLQIDDKFFAVGLNGNFIIKK